VQRCHDLAVSGPDAGSEDAQACVALTRALAARQRGAYAQALATARAILGQEALAMETIEDAYAECVEAVLALGDEPAARDLIAYVDALPPARATPFQRAQRHRLAARLAARRGLAEEADEQERAAIAIFREIETPFALAQILLDRAQRLEPDAGASLLGEARAIFERLGAAPWAQRAASVATAAAA
jgi:hypothetical protein